MRILSFDVGIKNLAYCLMEWDNKNDDKKQNLKIHSWNIINLIEDKNIDMHCMNKECINKVKSYIEFNNTKHYLCSRHIKNKDDIINEIVKNYTIDKWKLCDNNICSTCKNIDAIDNDIVLKKSKIKYYNNDQLNICLCTKHYKSLLSKVNNITNKICSIRNKKVKDVTISDIKLQLIKSLDEHRIEFLTKIDMVLIENQPTFKTPTMKAISDTIYTWFLIRGIIDKNINNASLDVLKFVSPSNKLKKFNQTEIQEADKNKKYKLTKKTSIDNTKKILRCYELNNWTDHLLSFIKKDDLADSFLQGWYVLNNIMTDQLYTEWQLLYDSVDVKQKNY